MIMLTANLTEHERAEVINEILILVSKHNLRTSIGAISAITMLFAIGYQRIELHLI